MQLPPVLKQTLEIISCTYDFFVDKTHILFEHKSFTDFIGSQVAHRRLETDPIQIV